MFWSSFELRLYVYKA